MADIQLTLGTFDPGGPPLCARSAGSRGWMSLCYLCPHSYRTKKGLRCGLDDRLIRSGDAYTRPEWKKIRAKILIRDREECTICGRRERLHIHHIDCRAQNDHQENLVTLCEYCHSRVHSQIGGSGRLVQYLEKMENIGFYNDSTP